MNTQYICKTLTIATRKSPLALCQTQYICDKLYRLYPTLKIKILPIVTIGDTQINYSLNKNKGLFIKELEYALIHKHADIAVHSMKDVTTPLPKELGIAVLCKRDDPRDALVSIQYSSINDLPVGAIIGTSSLRRKCQLHKHRPDLKIYNIRGNINTRIKKLHQKKYDALILSIAGLQRLSLDNYISMAIDPEYCLPAIGQGAIGIEYRLNDTHILSLLLPLNHKETAICINAERNINIQLENNCQLPIASYAKIENFNQLWLRALIGIPEKNIIIRSEGRAPISEAKGLSKKIAKYLQTHSKFYNNK